MNFRQWLEHNLGKQYMDIGHDLSGNYDSWYLLRGKDHISYASKNNADPEYWHRTDLSRIADAKGRVDHDTKEVSVVFYTVDAPRIEEITKMLKADFPGYKVFNFRMSGTAVVL